MVDIDALEQLHFSNTIAKFNKKHRCCIENFMKSNHNERHTKAGDKHSELESDI